MRRTVFIRRADQLNRTSQEWPTRPTEDADLNDWSRQRKGKTRLGRWGRPACLRRRAAALLEGRHIDLNPELHVRLGEIARRQERVQVRREVGGPGVVERVPVSTLAERGMKVVQERHGVSSQGKTITSPGYQTAAREPCGIQTRISPLPGTDASPVYRR